MQSLQQPNIFSAKPFRATFSIPSYPDHDKKIIMGWKDAVTMNQGENILDNSITIERKITVTFAKIITFLKAYNFLMVKIQGKSPYSFEFVIARRI